MKKIIEFFKQNSGLVVKSFVTQITVNCFALIISITMYVVHVQTGAGRGLLYTIAGLAGLFFFWFLLHDFFWQQGAKDHISIDSGRMVRDPLKGMKIALLSFSPTILFSLIYAISYFIAVPTQSQFFGNIVAVVTIPLFYLLDGMYYSFFRLAEGTYLLPVLVLLSCIVSLSLPTLAYYLGIKDKKLRSFVGLQNLDLPEKKDKK